MSSRISALLGWITLIALMGALWILFGEDPAKEQGGRGEKLFPGLETRLVDAEVIKIVQGVQSVTLVLGGDRWTVTEKSGYRADPEKIIAFLRGVARSKRREPKTMNTSRFSDLDLAENAKKIHVYTGSDLPLIRFNQGRRKEGGSGRSLTYVYKDGDSRAWLVSDLSALSGDPVWWLNRQILEINPSRFTEIITSGGVHLVRDSGTDGFHLKDLADTQTINPSRDLDAAARILGNLVLDDVRFVINPLVAPVGEITAVTGDGLTIMVSVYDIDGAMWASVDADFSAAVRDSGPAGVIVDAPADGAAEAQELRSKTRGWLFKLRAQDQEALTANRSDYLRDKGETDPLDGTAP